MIRHRFSSFNRWLALSLTLVLLISGLIRPIAVSAGEGKPLKSRSGKAQSKEPAGNGKEKRVPPVPPQPGAPQLMLPDLQTERQRERPAPQAPAVIASTIRSKRKPLESRQGRKVGDRLRPLGRSHHASRVRSPNGEFVRIEGSHDDGYATVRRLDGERSGQVAVCAISNLQRVPQSEFSNKPSKTH